MKNFTQFVKNMLDHTPVNSVEAFIKSHNPQTNEEVSDLFVIYEERQRDIARAIADHDYGRAEWIRSTM